MTTVLLPLYIMAADPLILSQETQPQIQIQQQNERQQIQLEQKIRQQQIYQQRFPSELVPSPSSPQQSQPAIDSIDLQYQLQLDRQLVKERQERQHSCSTNNCS